MHFENQTKLSNVLFKSFQSKVFEKLYQSYKNIGLILTACQPV